MGDGLLLECPWVFNSMPIGISKNLLWYKTKWKTDKDTDFEFRYSLTLNWKY